MMKKACLFLCAVLLVSIVCGCASSGSENSSGAQRGIATDDTKIMKMPADITDVSEFRCVCSLNDSECFTINGKKAKELYADAYMQSEKIEFQTYEGDSLYLSFQAGEESSGKLSDYYGSFSLSPNDYLCFSAAPMIFFAERLTVSEGTYASVLEMIRT